MQQQAQIRAILERLDLKIGHLLPNGATLTHIIEIRHGRYFPNTQVLARLWATGKRGAILQGYLMKPAQLKFEYIHPFVPSCEPGYCIYDGLRNRQIRLEPDQDGVV